ncbi:P94-like protein [Trichoplusia ni ascovirus 6b]|nr:P94-like protein [Trichoplusia ni ascovirus 6b]
MKTLNQFKKDVQEINEGLLIAGEPPTESKIIYLHWANVCCEVDEETIRKLYGQVGDDIHYPHSKTIVDWLKKHDIFGNENKIKLLYLITDGKDFKVNECIKSNEDMHYEMVVFHGFNQHPRYVDLSVAASFFKSRCVVYRNYTLYYNTNISKEFDYDKVNLDNFATERDQLKSYIKLKFINKFQQDGSSLQEITKLKKLRDRLFDEVSSKTVDTISEVNLETKNKNVFLHEFVNTDWYKNLNTPVHLEKAKIEKSISVLINYIVRDEKSHSFVEFNRKKRFFDFLPDCEIEFPDIIQVNDKGIRVVILTPFNLLDRIIFYKSRWSKQVTTASFNRFKSTMECPLFLLDDLDLSWSIVQSYTMNDYKQLLANNTNTEPRTQEPFHGGLVLTDTSHYDKYNDYILSATYFNGKKVKYNIGLFYYVLWKNCEFKKRMDRNVVEQFRKYAMRRISETVCNIGLSSLPLDPRVNTTLPTALWYCVELSSEIFKNDPQHYRQERLRKYYWLTCYMIEILTWFNYDLNLEFIEKRTELISSAMTLRKIQNHREKVYYLLKKIFNCKDGFLVSEIKNPSNLYKLNYLKLDYKGILRDDIVEEKVHLNDYVHLMYFKGDLEASKAGTGTFEIFEKTCPSSFAFDQDKSFYTEAIDSLEDDRVLSLHKLFIDYVEKSHKNPTLADYLVYVSARKKFHGDLITLFPSNILFELKDMHECYQKVVKKVGVKEFLEVCEPHFMRMERIREKERSMHGKREPGFITISFSNFTFRRK